jgi:hypothetical protein
MLEMLVGSVLTSAASRMVTASITGRDMNSDDVASIATTLLQAVVAAQAQTNESLAKIEAKLDAIRVAPFTSAMAAGQRLLQDAAPAHRTVQHRCQLLSEARTQFAIAVGSAPTPIAAAQAEVFYGLTWLGDRSVEDAIEAQSRAALLIEDEILATHPAVVSESLEYLRMEAARQTTQGKLKELFTGSPIFTDTADRAFNRLWVAYHEHAPLQQLRRATGWGDHGYPVSIPMPKGTSYEHADSMVTVPFAGRQPLGAFGATAALEVTSGPGFSGTVRIGNGRSEPLFVSLSMRGSTANTAVRSLLISYAQKTKLIENAFATTVEPGQTGTLPFSFASAPTPETPLEIRLQFGWNGQKGHARYVVESPSALS